MTEYIKNVAVKNPDLSVDDGEEDNFILIIENLKVYFELRKRGIQHAGFVRAVDGVDLKLRRGETIAIVGESGCGKTSLMKTILRINTPTGGTITFDGEIINDLKSNDLKNLRRKIGFVQQDPYGALAPFMDVQTIIEEPLKINGVKDRNERYERVRQALEEVRLTPVEDFLKKFPHQLSGGQQQRVVIARAMILNPILLVADEPVSMLDASVRVEILKLLRTLQEEHNLAVIYITHDLATVRYFSEFIYVMYAGQVIEKAPESQLINETAHPYSHALLAATSDPDPKNVDEFQEVPAGEPPSLVAPPAGCRFHPRCDQMISGLCDVKRPSEFDLGNKHTVACWLFKDRPVVYDFETPES
ncbi:MAG: ABC transporter ATP-binding protein [Clostridiaceae bacterium]|jgi:peptide/nickel transport system ATP-binding protein|nr:ABC transporter ATP-binding protein [Clostridiaceae bacterium]